MPAPLIQRLHPPALFAQVLDCGLDLGGAAVLARHHLGPVLDVGELVAGERVWSRTSFSISGSPPELFAAFDEAGKRNQDPGGDIYRARAARPSGCVDDDDLHARAELRQPRAQSPLDGVGG